MPTLVGGPEARSRKPGSSFRSVVLASVALVACGDDASTTDAGVRLDSGRRDAATSDAGTRDAGISDAAGGGCTSEDECTGATPHCDLAAGRCVGCADDDDCRGALRCDVATGVCRDCVTDDDCGGTRPICDRVSGQCTDDCATSADCALTGGPRTCDTMRGVCVDCIGNGMPCEFCELVTFSCVGCLTDDDCPASEPFCGPSYECSPECAGGGDCPPGLSCDPVSARCLECVTNADCPGEVCQVDHTCG